MDFMGLLQQILGGGQPQPMDIRPPLMVGAPAPQPGLSAPSMRAPVGGPAMPQGPGDRPMNKPSISGLSKFGGAMSAGMGATAGEDMSPLGAAASAFTAARKDRGAPSLMQTLMTPKAPGPPMDLRPPVAGGPSIMPGAAAPAAEGSGLGKFFQMLSNL